VGSGADRIGEWLLDLVAPRRCLACGRGEELFCEECRGRLLLLRGTACARCGCPTAWPVDRCGECAGRRLAFASARAAVAYEGPARPLVAAWKEHGLGRVAALAADLVVDVVPRPDAAALTFVPGDPDRVAWRGANPAEALAAELGRRWGLLVEPCLARARSVRPQRGLPKPARRANVREAFRATGQVRGAIALVDDVYTTGATADAAARELRHAGAGAVHLVAFARAVRA
jgi:predicted amidophosphoribosyltransferase